ncbi:penicillin acylase family protein [Nocardioides sp. BGMRC 2183]|nr:penicillin acylase family protein [Nocardioides sp. BGMRC 2183]
MDGTSEQGRRGASVEQAPQVRAEQRGFWDLPPSLRWTTYGVIGLVVLLVVTSLTAVVVVRYSWPQTSGTIELDGLDAPVEVVRDTAGIPQIYADTTHDLMYAQGFVHAQERFFEMDVRRHATAGRLAELFGEAGLESDLVVRTLGWRRVAEKELTRLTPATRDALDAYAQGVNAYLADRTPAEISLEYAVLGLGGLSYAPEKWSAVDSVAWLKAMAWDLRSNVDDEATRAVTASLVGAERAAELYPAYDAEAHPPIVEDGAVVDGAFDPAATPTSSRLRPAPDRRIAAALAGTVDVIGKASSLLGGGAGADEGIGSNSWVVDGSRTSTGAPILANDPHLGVSLPGVWMQVGLHCREISSACPYDVAGFSFSGVPGVVIGHNADIAWGFTNLGADVSDLYVERVVGDSWLSDRRQRHLVLRAEKIEVRGEEPMEITVRSTRHGPLLSDLVELDKSTDRVDLTSDGILDSVTDAGATLRGAEPAEPVEGGDRPGWEPGVALAWTALQPRNTADALFALNRADDWSSFRAAMSQFAVPGQNVVYADTDGHIGYQATGAIPQRRPGHDGTLPVAGWRSANDWAPRPVPFRALPWSFDPPSGAIVTANQQPIDPGSYPYALGEDWARGYRSSRIAELLDMDQELSVASMQTIQLDDRSAWAATLTPYLLDVELPGGYYSDGQELLVDWDQRQDADSAAAAVFNAAWRELLRATFDDELPPGLRPTDGARWWDVVGWLLLRPQNAWWDDVTTEDVVETRDDILRAAMMDARDELTALLSPDPAEWRWGDLHELSLRSPTLGESGIDLVERLFNRDGWDGAGGGGLVDATGWDAQEGYDVTTAPSMRMVVGLDDLDAARWINLTGVSGHAFHPHYTDQTDLWVRGEYLPWAFSRPAVLRSAEDTLTLTPLE